MSELGGLEARLSREPGLAAFKDALKNVVASDPETLNEFARALQTEINTVGSEESKDAIRNTIEAIRALAVAMDSD